MKVSKKILAFAVSGLFLVACRNQNNSETEESETDSTTQTQVEILEENLQEASFVIDGMHCEYGCARGIEKKLARIDGIKSAKIDFDSKQAKVEYDASMQTPQIIVQAVEAMGKDYKVSEVKSSSDQSYLYLDKRKPKSKEKTKEQKTENASDSSTDNPKQKKGCCSGKKSCDSKSKTI